MFNVNLGRMKVAFETAMRRRSELLRHKRGYNRQSVTHVKYPISAWGLADVASAEENRTGVDQGGLAGQCLMWDQRVESFLFRLVE